MGKYVDMADAVLGLKANNQGRLVEFDSPLFGLCYGKIREVRGSIYIITNHSVLEREVNIPASWIIRIFE